MGTFLIFFNNRVTTDGASQRTGLLQENEECPHFYLAPRKARGRENTTCSSRPTSSCAVAPPHSRNRATTCCTSSSGADAPAVTPTAFLPSNHSRCRNDASSMRYPGRPARSASSRSRLELELVIEPTTTSTSQLAMSSFTASWRFCVA